MNVNSQLHANEWIDPEISMNAAAIVAGELFDEADNDAEYHKPVALVRDELLHGKCSCGSEEIAERILAWSLAL